MINEVSEGAEPPLLGIEQSRQLMRRRNPATKEMISRQPVRCSTPTSRSLIYQGDQPRIPYDETETEIFDQPSALTLNLNEMRVRE